MKSYALPALMSIAFSAGAMPVAPMDIEGDQPCPPQLRYERARAFFQHVSIIAQLDPVTGHVIQNQKTHKFRDPRGPITEKAKEVHLKPEQVAQIRKTCGYVFCGDPDDGKSKYGGTGCVGGSSGMQMMTAEHVLFKPYTHIQRAEKCYIQNQDTQPKAVELDMTKVEHVDGGNDPLYQHQEMVLVRLKEKLTDVKPIPFSSASLKDRQTMLLVSAQQKRMPVKVSPYEPVFQSCTGVKTSDKIGPTEIKSDCAATRGASGSIGFAVEPDGNLSMNSVVIAVKDDDHDGCVFDDETCFTYSLGVNPRIADHQLRQLDGAEENGR